MNTYPAGGRNRMNELPEVYALGLQHNGIFTQYYNEIYTTLQEARCMRDNLNALRPVGTWKILKYGRPTLVKGDLT